MQIDNSNKLPLCACGCGNSVKLSRSGRPNTYIHGHSSKGKPKSTDHRRKLSVAMTGKPGYWTGKTMPSDARLKMSTAKKGKPLPLEHRNKIARTMTGKPHPSIHHTQSIETRKKKSFAQKGNRGSNWKGGKSKISSIIRSSFEFNLWRIAVMRRDHFTCQKCGAKHQKGFRPELHAHHIKPFSEFPELRFAVDNGITLCRECHMRIHGLMKGIEND